jgi:hypothetical protein
MGESQLSYRDGCAVGVISPRAVLGDSIPVSEGYSRRRAHASDRGYRDVPLLTQVALCGV